MHPDPKLFQDFNEQLRDAMLKETELFFEAIFREDRSVLDFLDADYTFVNERLAKHYGIDGVKGNEFRRVQLTGDQRGGVLTQASILTITSNPTRTSPVKRGKWILENILNAAPPPPPPSAAELSEKKTAVESARCGSAWSSTARIPTAPSATTAWTRSASASRTSTPSAPGARRTASSTSTRPAICPTASRSRGRGS